MKTPPDRRDHQPDEDRPGAADATTTTTTTTMSSPDASPRTLSRRALLGAGGVAVLLPVLPSLLSPREAQAQAMAPRKRFVQFCTHHGGIWAANMHPPDATLTEGRMYADRMVRRGDLAPAVRGTDAVISPVLTAPATALTPEIARKMNVVNGLDIPFYIGHHTGGHLGNYARNDGNGDEGRAVQSQPRQTIDQVMAWSPDFYRDLSGVRQRVMLVGGNVSWGWSNPATRSGMIQRVDGTLDSQALFDAVFGPIMAAPTMPTRRPIVDRVLENYRRLRNSDRRLSAEDRRRLDDHIARLSEIERRLATRPMCTAVTRPTSSSAALVRMSGYPFNPAMQRDAFRLLNDVIVLAMSCGASRVAAINASSTFSTFAGDWHQDIAHKAHLPTAGEQRTIANAHQLFFRDVYMDLVTKMDAVDDGNGATLLDNSLVVWTQESGPYTHDSQSQPLITAGSAGRALRTGSYIDYRNRGIALNRGGYQGATELTWAGLLWNQWLATALNAMGIPRAQWEEPGGGYGVRYFGANATEGTRRYPTLVRQNNSEMLPYLQPG